MRAIHVSVVRVPPVRGALSHDDHGKLRLSKFFIIIIIIIIIIVAGCDRAVAGVCGGPHCLPEQLCPMRGVGGNPSQASSDLRRPGRRQARRGGQAHQTTGWAAFRTFFSLLIYRPDITIMVDWALKISYLSLSIYIYIRVHLL